MPLTPKEAAEALLSVIPHAVPSATLEEYGIEGSAYQAQEFTKELLSLSLFWTGCALRVGAPDPIGKTIFEELYQCIRRTWVTDFELGEVPVDEYFQEVEHRRSTWEEITQQGGDPIAVISESSNFLESKGVTRPEDHQKVLGLLADLVPMEEIGEVAERIENEMT